MKRFVKLLSMKFALSLFFALPISNIGMTSNVSASNNIVDATDFGVTKNSPESQTEALHKAMRYFYDQEINGTVYLPAGTYSIDESLNFHADVNLIGDGIGQTILKKIGENSNYVVGDTVLHPNSTELNATISDLTIDADRTNREEQGLPLVDGINIESDVRNMTLQSIEIRNASNGAILRRTKDSIITESIFDGTSGHSIATGFEGYPVGDFTNVLITNNLIKNSTGGSGINLSRATYTTVSNNKIINEEQQSDTYGGIRIPNGGMHHTVSNNIRGCSKSPVKMTLRISSLACFSAAHVSK